MVAEGLTPEGVSYRIWRRATEAEEKKKNPRPR
jgi:hypothetical protein